MKTPEEIEKEWMDFFSETILNSSYPMTIDPIVAHKLSKKHIFIKCPCPKKCNKQEFHLHGNETGKLDNFYTSRVSHCKFIEYNDIIINNSTKRC
tara:strand:- start:1544 stop:1828 length:285 start_codon:yes stop_codon:yes gene_type:complete